MPWEPGAHGNLRQKACEFLPAHFNINLTTFMAALEKSELEMIKNCKIWRLPVLLLQKGSKASGAIVEADPIDALLFRLVAESATQPITRLRIFCCW